MNHKKIRAFRKKWKLTQRELADEIGVSLRTIMYWESGRKEVPKIVFKAIAWLEAKLKTYEPDRATAIPEAIKAQEENQL